MGKFIRASDILKEKGQGPPNFNTDAFFDAVAAFFRSHSVTATLTISVAPTTLKSCFSKEETEHGFAMRYKEDIERVLATAGLPPPRVCTDIMYVDKSFLRNAAALLSVMCGFVVEKTRMNGRNAYVVSLV